MKAPDLKSTVVAAIVGAVVAVIEDTLATPASGTPPITTTEAAIYGALLGAIVQIVVRVTGVS